MKMVKSENIIKFIECVESARNYYLVEEFAETGTLRDVLSSAGQLSESEATNYMIQLLNGFKELIKFGIVHRYFLVL